MTRHVPRSVPAALIAVLLALAAVLLPPPRAASAHALAPADPQATEAAARTLSWLGHLPNRAQNRVVSGFFGGYSGTTFGRTGPSGTTQTEDLIAATGRTPGVLGCDYGAGGSSRIDVTCNGTLKQWSRDGGLVTVSVHAPNPVLPTYTGLFTRLETFADLTDPATPSGAAWRAELDAVAAGLKDLADAGVPVLFRPLHEMNASGSQVFWWSNQDPKTFQAVWRDMFHHLTVTHGLHNLLWVYAPGCWSPERQTYYPGASYVDVAALDCYAADPAASQGYAELTALGKPFAFAEIGPPIPAGQQAPAPGTFDYRKWTEAIRTRFPATTFFLAWNDQWAPHQQLNADALMNDPWVVNRDEIGLSAVTEATGPARPAEPLDTLYGFEGATGSGSTEGWTGWQQLAGPWAVTEWASRGSHSLKADIDLARPEAYLSRNSLDPQGADALDLSRYATVSMSVRRAAWGDHAAGTSAKLYVRTGPDKVWYDSGSTVVGTDGAVLSLDLSSVPDARDVREIGVRFAPAAGASGRAAVYVDEVVAARPPTQVADFEGATAASTEGWTGWQTKNGPWSVTEWAAHGSRSLKADVDLAAGPSLLLRRFATPVDWSAAASLSVTARTAPWGDQAAGTRAKVYLRSGPDCTAWHDGGTSTVTSAGTRITYNLSGVPDRDRVCEVGVQFTPAEGATGGSAVYVDHVTTRA